MTDNVESMAMRTNDSSKISPIDALERAAEDFETGEFSKVLIIRVNDITKDNFHVDAMKAQLSNHEAIAAMEVVKLMLMKSMGY